MIDKIKSRFAAVNADENGAETIEVVLLTVFFVLVVAGVIALLGSRVRAVKVNESFTQYDAVTADM